MQARSLPGHYHSHHPNAALPPVPLQPHPADTAAHSYNISALDKHAALQCPILECAVTIEGGWYTMRRHFLFRHKKDQITIAEEGQLLRCPECGFQ